MSEELSQQGASPLAGPGSEGFSPFAGGWGRGRVEGALCQGTAAAVEYFLLPKRFPVCVPPHPEPCAFLHTLSPGQSRLAGENTGLWRLLPVGCLLHPC